MNPDQHNIGLLPLFPLGIVVMPGERVPLRIFEPRYLQLITECKRTGISFGIPYVKNGELKQLGTEVKLHRIMTTYPSGEMMIVIEGIHFIRIHSYMEQLPDKLYGGGKVETLESSLFSSHSNLIHLLEYLGTNTHDMRNTDNYAQINLLKLVLTMELSAQDRFRFISLPTLASKEKFLLGMLMIEKQIREQKKLLNENFQLN